MPQNEAFEFVGHTPEGLEEIIEQVMLADRIVQSTSDPSSGIGLVLNKARTAYLEALDGFTKTDLFAANGLQAAQGFQAEMRRYSEMVRWIGEVAMAGSQAKQELVRRKKDAEASVERDLQSEELNDYYGSEPTT